MTKSSLIALLAAACASPQAAPTDPVDVEITPIAEATTAPRDPEAEPAPAPAPVASAEPAPPPATPAPSTTSALVPGTLPGPPVTTATPLGKTPVPKTLAQAMTALAASDAQGMTPVGPVIAAQFKAGELLVENVQLAPGKCYTVLAASDTISELDVQLVMVPPPNFPMPPAALAVDNTTGPVAKLGAGNNCFKMPIPVPIPVAVVVKATTGQGIAVAQLFER